MSAESDLAGTLATWPEVLPDVRPLVDGSDFTEEGPRAVFLACCAEADAGQSWTLGTLAARLGVTGASIAEMAVSANPAFAVHHARLVHAGATKSRLIALLRQSLADLDETPATAEGVQDFAGTLVSGVSGLAERNGEAGREFEAGEILRALAARLRSHRGDGGIGTGIPDLDRVLIAMRPGDLIVVAGRTSMGKTALGLQVAVNTARAGKRTLVLSLEMPADQIGARAASNLADVDGGAIRRGEVTTEELERIEAEADELTRSGMLWMVDDTHATLGKVHAALRRCKRRRGLDIAVIDYAQRIRVPGYRPAERHLEVGAVTRSLKEYAKELGIPIVALAQLSRDAESSKPTLAHLRESGSIEMDSDVVILLHGERDGTTVTAIVAKNRDGRTEEVPLAFMRSVARIAGLERTERIYG